jgi:hypothetical protein
MTNPYLPASTSLQWFKSSYSNGSGGECVECAQAGAKVLVRDSKRSTGPVLAVAADPWQVFLDGISLQL